MDYDFNTLEEKARQKWVKQDVYSVDIDHDKPKYYVLDMFPYPSGAGLHVGHPLGYIASDIYARYKRLKGFNVLHPMGFDAFGLPAEQYAIQTGQHPEKTTKENIKRYKEQLNKIGFSFDWNREVITAEPEYYIWTQWIFIQLFNSCYDNEQDKAVPIEELVARLEKQGSADLNFAVSDNARSFTANEWAAMSEKEKSNVLMDYRLAYRAMSSVNWCEALGTVLANDEVKEGKSERGGHPVVKKEMSQWFLRITAYADRLLNGLDHLDWSDSMKEMQRNWIGKSYGASCFFKTEDGQHEIEIFTTRPDTIFGATFMVLAPEHNLVQKITTNEQQDEVEKYVAYVANRSDIERQQEKKVTGVFTGCYAINPLANTKIPIWISEYVLVGYGTGAIMAVPSDDYRDEAFAQKFDLPIIKVIDKSKYPNATKSDKLGVMINSDFITGMEVPEAIQKVNERLEELGIGKGKVNYRLRDAGFSRQRYWGEPFPVYTEDGVVKMIEEDQLPLTLPQVDSYLPTGTGESPLASATDWVNELGKGKVRETDTMPAFAGSSWYFLRYMDAQNEKEFVGNEAQAYWQDVDLYIGGTEHAVGHLLYSRFWNKFFRDMDWVDVEEPFKKLINQGMIQGRSLFLPNGAVEGILEGVHVPIQYADAGDKLFESEFKKLAQNDNRFTSVNFENGVKWENDRSGNKFVKLVPEVEKMSKNKFNVVNPDDIVEKYGADCFRMFEMFLGPIEQHKPWDTAGIEGVSKFLRKFWRLFGIDENGRINLSDNDPSPEALKILHQTIKKVNQDIERFSFNTCVSAFMVCTNELGKQKTQYKSVMEELVKLLSPFAPHTAESLWSMLGNTASVVKDIDYPVWDEKYLVEDSITYPISINGKVRTKVDFPSDATKESISSEVLEIEAVQKWLDGKNPKKVIVVPGRIVNVVV